LTSNARTAVDRDMRGNVARNVRPARTGLRDDLVPG
jgi:hypothetical protein